MEQLMEQRMHSVVAQSANPAAAMDTTHLTMADYIRALAQADCLFVVPANFPVQALAAHLAGTISLHHYRHSACLLVSHLRPGDLPRIRAHCQHVLVRPRLTGNPVWLGKLIAPLREAGFALFFDYDTEPLAELGVMQYARIGLAEFALSRPTRLNAYPKIHHGSMLRQVAQNLSGLVRTVVILDLIQDYEILKPLILRCFATPAWRDLRISVSPRVRNSHIWPEVHLFLQALNLIWFSPLAPIDTVNALGSGKSVLLTASESSANGHKFSHMVCRLAPRSALKLTVQHGYECVGLRHHLAHNLTLPQGVRFASDIVFTWSGRDLLEDINPIDTDKCFPVGVVKTIAETLAMQAVFENRLLQRPVRERTPVQWRAQAHTESEFSLLIAENLHSVRFGNAQRYQRFLDFINQANADGRGKTTIRSHPGKRTLEKEHANNNLNFLEGSLTAAHFGQYDLFVSPPSTILLDAVLAGLPSVVWSDYRHLGDCQNYAQMQSVRDYRELELCADPEWLRRLQEDNYAWAIDNVCAFNGAPQIWSRMNELVMG